MTTPAAGEALARVDELTCERQRLMAELAEVSEVWRVAVQDAGRARVPRARIAATAGVTVDRVYQILANL